MKKDRARERGKRKAEALGLSLFLAAAAALAWIALLTASAVPEKRPAKLGCVMGNRGPVLVETGDQGESGGQCPDRVRYIAGERININTASAGDLDLLPGIGPQTAQSIIASREKEGGFRSKEQVARVPGLSEQARISLETWAEVK
jgi:competence ComEA-like helix-hairpin-helix protein